MSDDRRAELEAKVAALTLAIEQKKRELAAVETRQAHYRALVAAVGCAAAHGEPESSDADRAHVETSRRRRGRR